MLPTRPISYFFHYPVPIHRYPTFQLLPSFPRPFFSNFATLLFRILICFSFFLYLPFTLRFYTLLSKLLLLLLNQTNPSLFPYLYSLFFTPAIFLCLYILLHFGYPIFTYLHPFLLPSLYLIFTTHFPFLPITSFLALLRSLSRIFFPLHPK